MKYSRLVIAIGLVGCLLALPLADASASQKAQLPAEPDTSDWNNLQQLRVGQKIEVVETNLKKHKGTFLSFSEGAISLRVKKDEVGVPRVNVLRVASLDRSKRKRNILLGVAIGAGLGVLAGVGVSYATLDEGDESKAAALIVGFSGAGAAALGAMGASSGYRTIYRADKQHAGSRQSAESPRAPPHLQRSTLD